MARDSVQNDANSSKGPFNTTVNTVIATRIDANGNSQNENLMYESTRLIGKGSFGSVYSATLSKTDQHVAIKKVLQDRRFKNRELSIMKRISHSNVVQLKYYFYTTSSDVQDADVYLNLVMDYVPETVYNQVKSYSTQKTVMPLIYTKLYIYQLFRALNYIHKDSICHRDIKPQNLLCNPATGILKLCDFGSAKQLHPDESNVSYICSRYYRAPELILCASHYTCAIDIWSCGCVLGELLLNQPLFPGESGVDQLVEIIKILGTPDNEQLDDMNPQAIETFKFPPVRSHPWKRVFGNRCQQSAIDLANIILEFSPKKRIKSIVALTHDFFKEIRDKQQTLPNGTPIPYDQLVNLTESECLTLLEAQNAPNGGAGKGAKNIFETHLLKSIPSSSTIGGNNPFNIDTNININNGNGVNGPLSNNSVTNTGSNFGFVSSGKSFVTQGNSRVSGLDTSKEPHSQSYQPPALHHNTSMAYDTPSVTNNLNQLRPSVVESPITEDSSKQDRQTKMISNFLELLKGDKGPPKMNSSTSLIPQNSTTPSLTFGGGMME